MSLYKNFESPESLRNAIALAKKTTVEDKDGRERSNREHDLFWPENVIPGVFGVFTATATLGVNLRELAMTSGRFMSPHKEIPGSDGEFSNLFLDQSPATFLDNADKTLKRLLGGDQVMIATVLARRGSGLARVSRANYLPIVFGLIQPGIEELLRQGHRGYDLSGDRLALMYRGQVR